MKLIRCPFCGEEIELTDLYEGMEIQCKLCNNTLIYEEGKFILLDTNEEFDIEDLEKDYDEFEEDTEKFNDFEEFEEFEEFDEEY